MIAVLVPIAVWNHVIGYRFTRAYFGLAGILEELAGVNAPRYETIFTLAIVVVVGWLGYRLWRAPPLARRACSCSSR